MSWSIAPPYREILCLRKWHFLNLELKWTSIFLFFKKPQTSIATFYLFQSDYELVVRLSVDILPMGKNIHEARWNLVIHTLPRSISKFVDSHPASLRIWECAVTNITQQKTDAAVNKQINYFVFTFGSN